MKALVVGARRFLQDKLKAYGVEAILFIDKEKSKPIDVQGFYKNIFILEKISVDSCVDLAIFLHETYRFDMILAYTDPYIDVACDLSDALDIPCNDGYLMLLAASLAQLMEWRPIL